MKLRAYFFETRPNFLILDLVLVFLGTSVAWFYGSFNLTYALLATVGLLLTHISVNVLNDYFDYKSGVDLKTMRTPFSGGSGILPAGLLTPQQALLLGAGAFMLAIPIGIYFVVVSGLALLPLLIVAALCVVLYTPFVLKTPWPEWSAGLGLGILPVLGVYFVQTGSYPFAVVMAAIPSGFLVHNLLLINEFPDVEADKTTSRKTLPIMLGGQKAAVVYSLVTMAMYGWIVGCVAARLMPVYALVALATLPLGLLAIRGSFNKPGEPRLVSALGQNVMVALLTQLLLGLGYVFAGNF